MLVTVITPVLNGRQSIGETIASVQGQKDQSVQHIIVDGGSVDGTIELVRNFPDITLLTGLDNGIYEALNKGLRKASGVVVGTLHAGDRFDDCHVLRDVANIFKNSKDLDVLVGQVTYEMPDGPLLRKYKNVSLNNSNLKLGLMPAHTGTFVKRRLLDELNYYDSTYRIAGDFDLFRRIHQKNGVTLRLIPRTITTMSFGGSSGQTPKKLSIKNKEILRSLRAGGIDGTRPLIYLRFFFKSLEFRLNWRWCRKFFNFRS